MAVLSIRKVETIPGVGFREPNCLYIQKINTNNKAKLWITSEDPDIIFSTFDSVDISEIFGILLGLQKGQALGLASLNEDSKIIQVALNADKLSSAVNINLTGDVTGTASFDGSANININTTIFKEENPVFSYTGTGSNKKLSTITYESGNTKTLFYNLSDVLTRVDYSVSGIIYRKDFNYDLDGSLESIDESIVTP